MTTPFPVLPALVRLLLSALADALSPPACAACDARLAARSVFCAACALSVARETAAFARGDGGAPGPVIAFGIYGGALAIALRRLKYARRPDLAVPLGHLARHAACAAHLTGEVVVPVPLHPQRLAERGYNQAALLAAEVAVDLAAPLAARALARVRNTPRQARLDREGRLCNVAEAFRVRAPSAVRGRRVVLVDDVATTGATLEACRAELLGAGASAVTALVVARAEGSWREPRPIGVGLAQGERGEDSSVIARHPITTL